MKKLLLSIAVVMSAMSVNAQVATLNVAKVADMDKNVYSMDITSSAVYTKNVMKAPVKLAAGANTFIEIGQEKTKGVHEEQKTIFKTNNVTMELTGESGDYKGTSYPKVKITGIGEGFGTVTGYVDDANGKIYIPRQVCYEYPDPSKNFGKMYFEALVRKGGKIAWDGIDAVLFKTENGYVAFEGKETEGAIYGWVITMPEYQTGQSAWAYGIASDFLPQNGVEHGFYRNEKTKKYDEGTKPIFIDDRGDELSVYNFVGVSKVDMLVDSESNDVYITVGQPIAILKIEDPATYGEYFRLYAYKRTGDTNIMVDNDAENIMAKKTNNVIATSKDTYFGIWSKFDSNSAGYRFGIYADMSWTKNADPTGITDVNSSAKKGDNKFYNLAGQRVNANTPGIVIRNGRKFLNK